MLDFIAHSQCVRCYVSKTNVYFRAAQFLDNSKNYSTIASMSRRLKTTFVYRNNIHCDVSIIYGWNCIN